MAGRYVRRTYRRAGTDGTGGPSPGKGASLGRPRSWRSDPLRTSVFRLICRWCPVRPALGSTGRASHAHNETRSAWTQGRFTTTCRLAESVGQAARLQFRHRSEPAPGPVRGGPQAVHPHPGAYQPADLLVGHRRVGENPSSTRLRFTSAPGPVGRACVGQALAGAAVRARQRPVQQLHQLIENFDGHRCVGRAGDGRKRLTRRVDQIARASSVNATATRSSAVASVASSYPATQQRHPTSSPTTSPTCSSVAASKTYGAGTMLMSSQ